MEYLFYLVASVGILAALVLTLASSWGVFASLGMALVLVVSLLYLAFAAERSSRKIRDLRRLRDAYDQLDQQAKLIIRTDLELHRAQEELDRRLASLMALYRLGQQLQVTLHPDEVFGKLNASVITGFGFSIGLLGQCQSVRDIEWRSVIGVTPSSADKLKEHLLSSGLLTQTLMNPAPRILQAASTLEAGERTLLELLGVPAAVAAGIISHAGPVGVLVLGRAGSGVINNTTADEELVAILTNQLASAVENSALYEQAWASQRELELKVQERTRELADVNAELMRLNKAKSDFVSAVSHELRTPLAAVKGYAALLGSGQFGLLAKPQGERVAKIEKHADLLTRFINDLLDIARIESGRVTMERNTVPVGELFASVHEVVAPQLEAKRLRYTVDQDGVTALFGDPPHLQRLFVNLLSNAIKYTPEGGAIRIGLKREGTSITATVTDTGCGISPDDLPNLFQEFYRANDPINQQIRGTGLGLALVKRIVEAHRGRIWVTSEKGKGSAFSVSLPAPSP